MLVRHFFRPLLRLSSAAHITNRALSSQASLQKLRTILDHHVIGQDDTKEAFLLALLSREHVYVEGPPGVAKTMISEIVSVATDLDYWFTQFHRDTRLNDLIGEAVIVRTQVPQVGEQIKHDVIPGGILTTEIAVLDDISRAPGEALNVMLRILQERRYGDMTENRIPLMTAIATGNPVDEEGYYGDPLDPATLDRFTLQVRCRGLISEESWDSAGDVIDLYSRPRPLGEDLGIRSINREEIIAASECVPLVIFPESCKRALLSLLQVLRTRHGCDETTSLLTDRTFLVKAVTVMKAQAVVAGRDTCAPCDLRVLRYLTTFRVPGHVHEMIDEIIRKVVEEEEERMRREEEEEEEKKKEKEKENGEEKE